MPDDDKKPTYTKKEEELLKALREDGQVIFSDIKDLKKLGKKLEEALGVSGLI